MAGHVGSRMRRIGGVLALLLAACGPKPKPAPLPTPEPEAEATPAPVADSTPGAVKSAAPKRATPAPKPATAKVTPIKRVPVSTQPPPADLWKEVSGERAWRTAKQLTELGPRPTGSMELGRAQGVLVSALRSAAWEVEQQSFTASTPRGEISGTNLIARFSADGERPVPRTPRSIAIGAHYDTRYFSTIRFVGANDGASGPALLVELARVLALDPQLAAKIELVLFDAAQPRGQFTDEDGIAGSKHYAKSAKPRYIAILEGVGDATSAFTLPPDMSIELLADLRAASSAVSNTLRFKAAPVRLWGDHIPFGSAALMFGNYDYLARNTADDTIDRVNPETIGRVGALVIWLTKHWAAQAP